MERFTGAFVKSLAGHDKDCYFFILDESGEYVYLVDGKYRPMRRPKKQKKKHVEAISITGITPGENIKNKEMVTDEEIKRFIKLFKREKREMEQVVRR